ncbi:AAA family ATPase [Mycobacterium sp. NPDC048908]|uniref:helix-turn-helix transcriptional regulator n=1 Tax=Mycobacterium sp. NPDC048908 TaxID=3364292 RepID=UPI0037241370
MPSSPQLLSVASPVGTLSVQADAGPAAARQPDTGLIGRRAECEVLDQLLDSVRAGKSRVVVVHGEPGVGKTALLDYVGGRAEGCRVIRATGVESEMELPYAALQQLCGPILDRLDRLQLPQRGALGAALGVTEGRTPDRLLIGLAVLSMFSDVAELQPLVCIVDDLQWIDKASAQILTFVARRLVADSVGLIVATRVPNADTRTLPTLKVSGLKEADARGLLDRALTAPIDERVREQLVAETRGNPLALLELPRGRTVQELAGGFGLPVAEGLSAAMEESFRREFEAFPDNTRQLLLLAAAEPLGDPALLWRAAARLSICAEAAAPAVEAEFTEFGSRVRFRHPLARSAAYRSAPLHARQRAHGALAEVTDHELDPDRRAWHRAHAAAGPDDDVADELDRSAGRARARGGLAAGAAFHERATMLTLDPAQRTKRALAAASAKVEAGAFDSALELLAMAESGQLDDLQFAHADLIRARLAFVTGRGRDAPALLVKAAKRLEPIDAELARTTYLEAVSAAVFAGRLAAGCGAKDVAEAAEASPQSRSVCVADLLLDGFAAHFKDGYAASLPILRRAVDMARRESPSFEQLRWLWLASIAALHAWDDDGWDVLSARHVELARDTGALSELPLALSTRAVMLLYAGELAETASLVHEVHTVKEATGDGLAPYGALILEACRGNRQAVESLIRTTAKDVTHRGEGVGLTVCEHAAAIVNNGVGDYRSAIAAARNAAEHSAELGVSAWAVVELIEAAARSGSTALAKQSLSRLTEMAEASATDWALGVEARSRALLSEGAEAESLYRDAIERLGRTRMRAELARAHLLYGEWLRRKRRRTEARTQLRVAHGMFDAMGMQAFAERAGRELHATGETAHKRSAANGSDQLTPQEAQIARLARDGLSNPEIGARLFISTRTVQYHLRKVFAKLGINTRHQLYHVLSSEPTPQLA